ncbi:MAG: T9SS type A sorting domain-containing protein, partial [Xanthomarina gelatinilytica]|nr:T9SS type A sorting domain-containing protein [Xanthomarina gelatinilytica]
DPPDDFEMNRNNVIYNWQFNRNPFIDQPDLVEYIWGNMVGETWEQNLSVEETQELKISVYPNPTQGKLYISGVVQETTIEMFSVDGRQLMTKDISGNTYIDLDFSSGLYLLKMASEGKTVVKKVLIK